MTTDPDDSDYCPLCRAQLHYQVEGFVYSRRIGVEVRGVYDGILFWLCPDCDGRWHRWPINSPYRARAQAVMDSYDNNREP